MSRIRLTAAAAFAALVVLAPSAAADPLTFAEPQYVDQSFAGGEPVLQVDTVHHTLVYSSHEGTTHIYRQGLPSAQTLDFFSEYRNQTKMWTSKDNGLTWERVDFLGTGFATDPTKNSGFSDPDFAMDASGRIYNTGINLISQAIFSSPDGGLTWDRGTPQCTPGDRPWLAGGNPDEAWLATNLVSGSPSHQVFHTTDGGMTCSASGIPSEEGNGKIYFDHASQRLVEPAQQGRKLGISVWKRGDAEFTFKPSGTEVDVYAHWPAIALDGAGTIYLVWDENPRAEGTSGGCDGAESPLANSIRMISTKDFGETWSRPVEIARMEGNFAFWPWVAAGDKGKVSVVWYETDKLVDVGCEPSAISIHAASVLNADSDQPRIEVVDAGGRPISQAMQICQSGTTCVATGEDRRLGDFFTNAIDERGCVVIASGDTMNPDPVTGGDRNVALPIFIRQTAGPRMIGEGDCSGRPQPAPGAPPAEPNVRPTQPPAAGVPLPSARRCTSRRRFPIRLRAPKGQQLRSAKVYVNGKRVKVRRKNGRLTAMIDLRRLRRSRYVVKVVAVTGQGRTVRSQRRYRTCSPMKR